MIQLKTTADLIHPILQAASRFRAQGIVKTALRQVVAMVQLSIAQQQFRTIAQHLLCQAHHQSDQGNEKGKPAGHGRNGD